MSDTVRSAELRVQMDAIYRDMALEKIPWNIAAPPAQLVDLVESGRITPCDAVELGCGAGNYAAWLATKGFNVIGIDLSAEAVALATRLAASSGAACRFVVGDVVQGIPNLDAVFDFAYDWEVLHHVAPVEREAYARNVARMLRPGATYLSVAFSEADASFGGTGKVRRTPIGTTLYFSSVADLGVLFEPHFEVLELGDVRIAGKFGPQTVVRALMRRR